MALPGKPVVWSPSGCSDTLDASTAPSGSMTALTNLIPDPTTKNLWQCRPAQISLTAFAGFSSPAFISVFRVLGDWVYGMVASSRNAGKDEPFAYNIATNSFATISGVTALNTPVSPQSTGVWTPPSMALVGTQIIISHPGFTGSGGAYFGVLDISTASAPTWTAQNTTGLIQLQSPPTWVAQFNGRCWYLLNPSGGQPSAVYSDSLVATNCTNANQAVTFGDNIQLTCAAGLPLNNVLGGVVQALIVFKGVENIYQITGDATENDLLVTSLNIPTGTLAPNSVQPTTKGLAFISPDGLRVINFSGNISDPIGTDGQGVAVPFISALTPSRIAAGFNADIYRATVQNGNATGSPQQEWWYDFKRNIWSGPHTSNVSLYGAYLDTFVTTMIGVNGTLWESDVVQSNSSTYVENGTQLTYSYATPMFPDTDQMAESCTIETTLHAALVVSNPISVIFQDQNGTIYDTVSLAATGSTTIWGSFTWGQALWQGASNALYPRQLAWHAPIVFTRGGIVASGNCASGLKLGRLHIRLQVLGYLLGGEP